MANITDATAVAFSNQYARVFADSAYAHYKTCKAIIQKWNSGNYSAIITNVATDMIVDGSGPTGDGRTPISSADVTNLITRAQEVVTDYEAASNAKLNTVSKPSVNPTAKF